MGVKNNGSTILGVALGNHPKIEFVGELSILPRAGWVNDYTCACGDLIAKCQYWTEVREIWENSVNDSIDLLIKLEDKFDRNRRLLNLFIQQTSSSSDFAIYSKYVKAFFEAIRQVSGKDIVVDSSKRFSRALALSSVKEIDLRLIHLLRDARGVAYSWSKPTRPRRRPWWNSSVRWNVINAASDLVGKKVVNGRAMRLRYEDFISQPKDILENLGTFIGVNLDSVADLMVSDSGLSVNHVGVGNGFLQRDKKVKLRPYVEWPEKMPLKDQRNVWRITKRKMRSYGYREEPDATK